MADYRGMTTNDRVFAANLFEEYERAARKRDRTKKIELLSRVDLEMSEVCVRDFCEDEIAFADIENEASTARSATLLGRAERSSPKAAQRARREARGLDGEGADRAIIDGAVMLGVLIIGLPESARRTGRQTGPWQPSIGSPAANASWHS
jgi:hypothetical protein